MKTMRLLAAMFVSFALSAETVMFQWDPNTGTNVTGYILDYSKTNVATNVFVRSQASGWLLSTNITGRLTTNATIVIPSAQFSGTNFFYLTAVTATTGLVSNLSIPVRMEKPIPVTGGAVISVTVQSTTNLSAAVWTDEATVPVELAVDTRSKVFRSRLNISKSSGGP